LTPASSFFIPVTNCFFRVAGVTAVLLLEACVMVPRTVAAYDPQCRMVTRQMTIEPVQLATIGGCSNQGCLTLVAVAAVTGAASTVVSGTIAVAGNVVYWVERQGRCLAGPAEPVPPYVAPPS
jgi:hypothetical protein